MWASVSQCGGILLNVDTETCVLNPKISGRTSAGFKNPVLTGTHYCGDKDTQDPDR